MMPASNRQRTVRQPASPAKAKACRQATMRALIVQEVMLCNGAEDGLNSGFISHHFGLSRGPAPLPDSLARRRLAAQAAQQPRAPGLPQPARGLQERADQQDTGALTAAALATEA